jgi:hypothetical protein
VFCAVIERLAFFCDQNVLEEAHMATAPEGFTRDQYIELRVKQYQGWYDRKAVTCKSRYLRMRAFTVVAGGIVPVLVNVEASINNLIGYPVMKAVITVISLLVVVTVSLESVFHYREQWKNYRSTEQLLGHEQFEFLAKVGVYEDSTAEGAFQLFVERIEDAISSENAATLNVMTVGSEAVTERPK